MNEVTPGVNRLRRDLRKAEGGLMSVTEARFNVDSYYSIQKNRIAYEAQINSLEKVGEPVEVLHWLFENTQILESQLKRVLDVFTDYHLIGPWLKSQKGIGPVIAAGLIAHIDINKAPTAGHIWSFAGLVPEQRDKWKKGSKRPWNARLKTLCWKAGEAFVKTSNLKDAYYGEVYKRRKEQEIAKNLKGDFKSEAEYYLNKFNYGKETEAYKHYIVGTLPPAHIHARAKRYAVRLFLAHLQQVWYEKEFKVPAPKPYIIAHDETHTHYLAPPNYTPLTNRV